MKAFLLFIVLAFGTFLVGLAAMSLSRPSTADATALPTPVVVAPDSELAPIAPFSGAKSWGVNSAPPSGACGSGCSCGKR
jgi:hypothetical protein